MTQRSDLALELDAIRARLDALEAAAKAATAPESKPKKAKP